MLPTIPANGMATIIANIAGSKENENELPSIPGNVSKPNNSRKFSNPTDGLADMPCITLTFRVDARNVLIAGMPPKNKNIIIPAIKNIIEIAFKLFCCIIILLKNGLI